MMFEVQVRKNGPVWQWRIAHKTKTGGYVPVQLNGRPRYGNGLCMSRSEAVRAGKRFLHDATTSSQWRDGWESIE